LGRVSNEKWLFSEASFTEGVSFIAEAECLNPMKSHEIHLDIKTSKKIGSWSSWLVSSELPLSRAQVNAISPLEGSWFGDIGEFCDEKHLNSAK